MKTCCRCKVSKEESEFVIDRRTPDGKTGACKECRKNYQQIWYYNNLDKVKAAFERDKPYRKEYYSRPKIKLRHNLSRIKRDFGLESDEYLKMVEDHQGNCAICGNKETSSRSENLSVDHCHTTGKVRGLLCSKCNRGLGLFLDDLNLLELAINYLKKHKNEYNTSASDGLLQSSTP